MEYTTIMSKIKAVSSVVASYIDEEKYLPQPTWIEASNGEDGYWEMPSSIEEITDQTLLNDSYLILLDELRDMGIEFHCDQSELLGNFYDAECIYLLRKIFSPLYLYTVLLGNTELRVKVKYICEDLTDVSQKIVTILELLQDTFTNDQDYARLYGTLWDKIYNNVDYIKHINSICDLIVDHGFNDIGDIDNSIALIQHIEQGQSIARTIFELAMKSDPTLDTVRLYNDLSKYNVDKIQPTNINNYSWWLANENTRLDSVEKMYWDKLDYDHNKSNNHHIEYYQLTPKDRIVNKEDLINILANLPEPNQPFDRGSIQDQLNRCIATLFTTHDIDMDAISLVNQVLSELQL